jgi:hypothetical protein
MNAVMIDSMSFSTCSRTEKLTPTLSSDDFAPVTRRVPVIFDEISGATVAK